MYIYRINDYSFKISHTRVFPSLLEWPMLMAIDVYQPVVHVLHILLVNEGFIFPPYCLFIFRVLYVS